MVQGGLAADIVASLFDLNFAEVGIWATSSHTFRISNVLGPGIRHSDTHFSFATLTTGDTVYFYFDYTGRVLKFPTPAIQFHIRYFDRRGHRVVRTMTTTFTMTDNVSAIVASADDDVCRAAVATLAADKYREFGRLQNNDLFPETSICDVFGRSPTDVARFLAPTAYALSLGSAQLSGPFPLRGYPFRSGALYIPLPRRRAALLLADGEDVVRWSEEVKYPPIQNLIGTICRETTIEIVSPLSVGHPLLDHLRRCMAAEKK
jgi:hypothetical protein